LAEILPPQVLKAFKKELTYLGKQSNRLRDWDVYVLREEQYRRLLPEEMRRDMELLFRQLREKRQKAHKKLVKTLQQERFRQILQDWQKLAGAIRRGEQVTERGHLDAGQVIKPIIARQMERVLSDGRQIDSASGDDMLHKLRIDCKKLRYLLEFFASLFPGKLISVMVRQLKALQDHLGDFNDLAVQQQFLRDFLNQLPGDDPHLRGTCAAIGALIGKLNERQQLLRLEFERRFREFDSAKNRQMTEGLFSV
jgi:CHAD domain-containing protein